MTDPFPIPEGQLCQAKDEDSFTPFVNDGREVMVWGRVRGEGACPHPATVRWGDFHAFNHGGGSFWCEHCALDAQIAHAEERVRVLADLKEKRRTVACLSSSQEAKP